MEKIVYKFRGMDERSVSLACGEAGRCTNFVFFWRSVLFLGQLVFPIVDAFTYYDFFKTLTEYDKKVDWTIWILKPHNWLAVLAAYYQFSMMRLHYYYNHEIRFNTLRLPLITYYLFNILGVYSWVHMIFYFNKIRIQETYEPALEATMIYSVVAFSLDCLFVNHYITYDVLWYIWITFISVMSYVFCASMWFEVNFYSQFNWISNFKEARVNFLFLMCLIVLVTVPWFVILRVKSNCRSELDASYETPPTDVPIVESFKVVDGKMDDGTDDLS